MILFVADGLRSGIVNPQTAPALAAVRDQVWPLIGAGQVAAVIDRELPMSQAAQAHRAMAASDHFGKILLRPE